MNKDVEALALRPRDAAKALGVSERTLWQLTRDGKIPAVRTGGPGQRSAVLYSVDALRAWLAQSQSTAVAVTSEAAPVSGNGGGM